MGSEPRDPTLVENGTLLSNKAYDHLKTFALIILPALGTFYVALSAVWGLPAAEEVTGTTVALVAFLGVIVKLGDASYNASEARFDGLMLVNQKPGGGLNYNMALNGDPEDLQNKKEVIFKVKEAGT